MPRSLTFRITINLILLFCVIQISKIDKLHDQVTFTVSKVNHIENKVVEKVIYSEKPVELPHPSREMAQQPMILHFDNRSMCSAGIGWAPHIYIPVHR